MLPRARRVVWSGRRLQLVMSSPNSSTPEPSKKRKIAAESTVDVETHHPPRLAELCAHESGGCGGAWVGVGVGVRVGQRVACQGGERACGVSRLRASARARGGGRGGRSGRLPLPRAWPARLRCWGTRECEAAHRETRFSRVVHVLRLETRAGSTGFHGPARIPGGSAPSTLQLRRLPMQCARPAVAPAHAPVRCASARSRSPRTT